MLREVQVKRKQCILQDRSPVDSDATVVPWNGQIAPWESCCVQRFMPPRRRQIGYGSPTDQLDGATLLFAPLHVPWATRR